jgi:hypothetical protein
MRRLLIGMVIATVVAACALVPVGDRPPVVAGPLGPVVPGEGGSPPVECRAVPLEQCKGFANMGEADVARYIVTCTSICTPLKGDVRIDIVGTNGLVRSAGVGSYASAEAEPAPAATPLPSDPGPS